MKRVKTYKIGIAEQFIMRLILNINNRLIFKIIIIKPYFRGVNHLRYLIS